MPPAAPALLGERCQGCGSYRFPRQPAPCPNPSCDSEHFEVTELSRQGRLWSYTNAGYQPPPPFIPKEPFESFGIAAVELAKEGLVILGQIAHGVSLENIAVGDTMQLVREPLYEAEGTRFLVWKWAPVSGDEP